MYFIKDIPYTPLRNLNIEEEEDGKEEGDTGYFELSCFHPPHVGMTGIALKLMQRLRKKFAQIGSTRERSLEEGPTCGAAAAAASSGASAAATDE